MVKGLLAELWAGLETAGSCCCLPGAEEKDHELVFDSESRSTRTIKELLSLRAAVVYVLGSCQRHLTRQETF
jgi:hypothetical protein